MPLKSDTTGQAASKDEISATATGSETASFNETASPSESGTVDETASGSSDETTASAETTESALPFMKETIGNETVEWTIDPTATEIEQIVVPKYFVFRRWFDRMVALLLLIPGLPIMLFVSMLLILTDGPVFYRQRRVGLNGRVFTLMKFRTMIPNAEKGTGPVWTSVNDPRITWLGKILRPTHIDELPQLFNVLMGEMMLIGPRPERPEFTGTLAEKIPGYYNRNLIPPGVTGLAQMNLPADSDLDSVRRKLTLDLEYIKHGSFGQDFRLFCATFLRLIGIQGDRCVRWVGIKRIPVVPAYMYPGGVEEDAVKDDAIPQTYVDEIATQAMKGQNE